MRAARAREYERIQHAGWNEILRLRRSCGSQLAQSRFSTSAGRTVSAPLIDDPRLLVGQRRRGPGRLCAGLVLRQLPWTDSVAVFSRQV